MNKINAFTVMELLIAMIVSGIVVALALRTIPNLAKGDKDIIDFNTKINNVLLFIEVFERDILCCDLARYEDVLEIEKGSFVIRYHFNSNCICLENITSYDTIYLGPYSYNVNTISSSNELVKDVSLLFNIGNDTLSFIYPLTYPKATYYGR